MDKWNVVGVLFRYCPKGANNSWFISCDYIVIPVLFQSRVAFRLVAVLLSLRWSGNCSHQRRLVLHYQEWLKPFVIPSSKKSLSVSWCNLLVKTSMFNGKGWRGFAPIHSGVWTWGVSCHTLVQSKCVGICILASGILLVSYTPCKLVLQLTFWWSLSLQMKHGLARFPVVSLRIACASVENCYPRKPVAVLKFLIHTVI